MQQEQATWYSGEVLNGNHLGRTIGFPTLNLDSKILSHIEQDGVYSSVVEHDGNTYAAALYLGPRVVLGETKRILEVHVLDFDQMIYGATIRFRLGEFIRGVIDFSSFQELKEQLEKDRRKIKSSTIL